MYIYDLGFLIRKWRWKGDDVVRRKDPFLIDDVPLQDPKKETMRR